MKQYISYKYRKGAIFDLDGTLLDSMGVWREIDREFLGKRGIELTNKYMKAITSKTFEAAAKYTIEQFGLHESLEDIVQEWLGMAIDIYKHEVQLKPYVKEYIFSLKEKGIKIAAATSSDTQLFSPCLKHHGIYDWFDSITVTGEAKRGKGFPDVYEIAADKIGLTPKECVVYEDILKGIEGAKMGNFYTVGVEDTYSAYEKEDIKREADCYIESFEQLLR